jgi:hypothetical protein
MNAQHYAHNDYYEKGHTIPGIAFGNLSAELGIEPGAPVGVGQKVKSDGLDILSVRMVP